MSSCRFCWCVVAALASCVFPAGTAGADEDPAAEAGGAAAAEERDWHFDLAVYGWLTDLTGEISTDDVTVDVDPQLFNDILANLDGALMGAIEARYRGRWIVSLDLSRPSSRTRSRGVRSRSASAPAPST